MAATLSYFLCASGGGGEQTTFSTWTIYNVRVANPFTCICSTDLQHD